MSGDIKGGADVSFGSFAMRLLGGNNDPSVPEFSLLQATKANVNLFGGTKSALITSHFQV
jgi:hypothetical protein